MTESRQYKTKIVNTLKELSGGETVTVDTETGEYTGEVRHSSVNETEHGGGEIEFRMIDEASEGHGLPFGIDGYRRNGTWRSIQAYRLPIMQIGEAVEGGDDYGEVAEIEIHE